MVNKQFNVKGTFVSFFFLSKEVMMKRLFEKDVIYMVCIMLCMVTTTISIARYYQTKVDSLEYQIQMYKDRWETRDKAATYYKQQLELERAKNGSQK
nr:MAG TPA: hypothetical protein [Caudoviricetes sp.]